MAYSGSMPSSASEETLDSLGPCHSHRREERIHPAYRIVIVSGLPASVDVHSSRCNRVNKFTLFSFADSLCSHYGHMRFPEVRFNVGRNEYGKKSATFIFKKEEDAKDFCKFPHANPFPKCRLILTRVDPYGELMDDVAVESPEFNKNLMVSHVIVLFQDLPKSIRQDDIINLIGEDFIKIDENDNFCVKIFRGRQTISAKVIMVTHYYAHSFVEKFDGQIFHPFNKLISVCLN